MKKIFLVVILLIGIRSVTLAQWVSCNVPGGYLTVVDNKIFVGTLYYGVYSSEDDGVTWKSMNNGLSILDIKSIIYDNKNLFVGTGRYIGIGGIFISSDLGNSWNLLGSNNYPNKSLFIDNNNIYEGTTEGGNFISNDYGKNWHSANNGRSGQELATVSFARIGNNILAGTPRGIFITKDTGNIWTKINSLCINGNALVVNEKNVFAGVYDQGLYISKDSGLTWNLMADIPQIQTLAVKGNIIVAATWGYGIYLSTDNGISWKNSKSGLPDLNNWSVAIKDSLVFVMTLSGTYKTTINDIITAVEDNQTRFNSDLNITPNPATDNISFSFSNSYLNTSISIYNSGIKELFLAEGFIIVGVFGSYSRDENIQVSDIDILYDLDKVFRNKYRGFKAIARLDAIQKTISSILNINADLVQKSSLGAIAAKYILPEVYNV